MQMFASDADIEALCHVLTGNLREGSDHISHATPTHSELTLHKCMWLNVFILFTV